MKLKRGDVRREEEANVGGEVDWDDVEREHNGEAAVPFVEGELENWILAGGTVTYNLIWSFVNGLSKKSKVN